MLDGLNSGFQAVLNPGDKLESNAGERFADVVLWIPRKLWAERIVDTHHTFASIPDELGQSSQVISGEKIVLGSREANSLVKSVRNLNSPEMALAGIGFGLLSLLASPLLLIGGIIKGCSVMSNGLSRRRIDVVQKELKTEILIEKDTVLGIKQWALVDALADAIQAERGPLSSSETYNFQDIAKALVKDRLPQTDVPPVVVPDDVMQRVRELPAVQQQLRKMDALFAQIKENKKTLDKTIAAGKQALATLNEVYFPSEPNQ